MGNTFTSYVSSSGTTRRQVGILSASILTNVLNVRSVNDTTLSTVTFDNVSITGSTGTSSTTTDYYGYTATGDTPDFLTDASGNVNERYLTPARPRQLSDTYHAGLIGKM